VNGNKVPVGPKLHRFGKILTDDDFENLPAENIDWEDFGAENMERLKQWTKQKEREIINQATLQQYSTAIFPVGRDRFFRRYWMFQSVPGLFVEQAEDCLSVQLKVCRTDGENCELKAVVNGNSSKCSAMQCTSDGSTSVCNKSLWSFYETSDSIDQLLLSLNARGFREGPLRAVLNEQSERLRDCVNQCNSSLLKTRWTRTAHNASENKCSEGDLQCILREMILDFEERIYTGSLGFLKVRSLYICCF